MRFTKAGLPDLREFGFVSELVDDSPLVMKYFDESGEPAILISRQLGEPPQVVWSSARGNEIVQSLLSEMRTG